VFSVFFSGMMCVVMWQRRLFSRSIRLRLLSFISGSKGLSGRHEEILASPVIVDELEKRRKGVLHKAGRVQVVCRRCRGGWLLSGVKSDAIRRFDMR
jgi:hypothetical protein